MIFKKFQTFSVHLKFNSFLVRPSSTLSCTICDKKNKYSPKNSAFILFRFEEEKRRNNKNWKPIPATHAHLKKIVKKVKPPRLYRAVKYDLVFITNFEIKKLSANCHLFHVACFVVKLFSYVNAEVCA